MRLQTAAHKKQSSSRRKELNEAILLLKQGDTFIQDRATEMILAMQDRESVGRICPLLEEKDTGIRMTALEILKQIGHLDPGPVAALLDHPNEDIRVYGCEILAGIKVPSTVDLLITKMTSDEENVRTSAATALGEFRSDKAVDALLRILSDDEWLVFSAIYSLGKIGSPRAVEPLLDVFRGRDEEVSLAAFEVLLDIVDDDRLDEMLAVLRGWNKKKRGPYVKIVIERGDPNVFAKLKRSIGNGLFDYLAEAIDGGGKDSLKMFALLADFHSREAATVILERLKDLEPDSEAYEELLAVFCGLSDVWKEDVATYLNQGDGYAFPLIQACVRSGIAIREGLLSDLFRSAPQPIRREIVANVPSIVEGDGIALVREAVGDSDGHVRSGAIQAVGRMSLFELTGEIIENARTGFVDVRTKALQVLADLNRETAVRLVDQFVRGGSIDDKKIYLAAAERLSAHTNLFFLKQLIRDDDERIRHGAVRVMGNFLDEPSYMTLFASLLDEENIPHEVLKVIRERRLTAFRDRLVAIFKDQEKGLWTRYYALLALGSFEDKALLQTFITGLTDENSLIKIGSLKALSDLGDRKAIRYVRPFTHSPDEDIRSTAEFVLGRLEG